MSSLFRKEAIAHHRQRLYGEVVMTLPVTHWAVTALIAVVISSLLALLAFGTYARKETIGGWIRPDRGIVRVQATEEGVVEKVFVREGELVRAGAPLLTLKLDSEVAQGESYGKLLTEDLAKERRQLEQQLDSVRAQYEVKESRVRGEIEGLEREVGQYRRQTQILEHRIALSQKQVDQRASLVTQGFVSPLDAAKFEDALLAATQAKEDLVQETLAKEHKLRATRFELRSLPHEREVASAQIGEKLATLKQRVTEAGRRSQVVLSAPIEGRVSDVRVEPGETAKAKTILLEILPSGAELQAELFAPSRAIGFIKEGAEVQLRYDSFPYQKFGVGRGKVIRVSRSTMDGRELPRTVVGDEPVYRILVALAKKQIEADGHSVPLQSGMTLKADLILERQRLGEFIFAPFFGAVRRG